MRDPVGNRAWACFERGLSLIEVLIAGAIFSIAMLGIAGMFPTGSILVDGGGVASQALAFAQQKVEQLRNTTPFPPSGGSDVLSAGSKQLNRSWTVSLTGSSPNRLATITVTVNWLAIRPGRIQLMTMVTEP